MIARIAAATILALVALLGHPTALHAGDGKKEKKAGPPSHHRIAEMTRRSEVVAIGKATKIDEKNEPPLVDFAVEKFLKGKAAKVLKIGLLADDIGGDEGEAPKFEAGGRYVVFVTEIQQGQYCFLFQNLSGKLKIASGAWQTDAEKIVAATTSLDNTKEKSDRTKKLEGYIKSPSGPVRVAALREITTNSGAYDIGKLRESVMGGLGHASADVRRYSVMAVVRVSNAGRAKERDLDLIEKLVKMLNDKDKKVRKTVHQQLASLARTRIDFEPDGSEKDRKESIKEWNDWIAKQRENAEIFREGE